MLPVLMAAAAQPARTPVDQPTPPTESLLQRIASGDSVAVRECIDRWGPILRGMARRLLGSGPDSDDALQEAFIAVWRAAPVYNPQLGAESTFIVTIARRRLLDVLRSRKRSRATQELSFEPPDREENVPQADQSEELGKARRALQQLRTEERQVLELCLIDGLSQSQAAAKTGMALGTVKTHARRGMMRLRRLLGIPVSNGDNPPTSDLRKEVTP